MVESPSVKVESFHPDEMAVLCDWLLDLGFEEGSPVLTSARTLAQLTRRRPWLRKLLTEHEGPIEAFKAGQDKMARRNVLGKAISTARQGWMTELHIMVRLHPEEIEHFDQIDCKEKEDPFSYEKLLEKTRAFRTPLTLSGFVPSKGKELPRTVMCRPDGSEVWIQPAFYGMLFRRHPNGEWFAKPSHNSDYVQMVCVRVKGEIIACVMNII